MEITVDRFVSDDDTTVSRVSVDGRFVCFGFEGEFREQKLASETRIPKGRYDVRLRTEGSHHNKCSSWFSNMCVPHSTAAYRRFYPMVAAAVATNDLTIRFEDYDRP